MAATFIFASVTPSTYASKVDLDSAVKEVIGTPYLYGGTTTAGFDCSGFILYILNRFGVDDLPRTSHTQSKAGAEVEQEELRVGDLVFFNTSGRGVSHSGIYVGDNKFAHSSSSRGVVISSLSESYYKSRYVTARRVISEDTFSQMSGQLN